MSQLDDESSSYQECEETKVYARIKNENKFKKYYIDNPNFRSCLTFLERFDIRNKFGDKIGWAVFDVTFNHETELFTVHVHAEGYIKNGVFSIKSIFSRVNCKFETIEEIRQTRIGREIKHLCLLRYPDYYSCIITNGELDGDLKKRRFKLDHQRLLLGEGAITLLYRVLGIRGMDVLETFSINNYGSIVSNTFESGEVHETLVREKFSIQVTMISRKVFSLKDNQIVDHVQTLMTSGGYCVHHEWTGKNVSMTVPTSWNPLLYSSCSIFSSSDDPSQDFQLKGKAKDLDQELKATYRSYLKDKPDILHLIGDYLQEILLNKPDDVYEFTKEFFNEYN